MEKIVKNTPWGAAQHHEVLAPGIVAYGTAGHGGIRVDKSLQAKIPQCENFLNSRTWWEEDCDWVIPYIVFRDAIQKHGSAYKFNENLSAAYQIAKHYHPNFFKAYCVK